MPTISVIVPVYKVEPYLKRCIDSILCQTFTDFELILVDDGSPDRCGEICDEYAKKDSRIKVIHKENGGLSSARNRGIDRAFQNSDSKFLSFIDSDDYVHPSFLEYLYKALIENDVKISVCNVIKTYDTDYVPQKAEYSAEKTDAMDFYKQNPVWATVAWNKLYAKDVFNEYRYPEGKIHEDEFLTYKLLYNAKEVVWIDLPLYVYFQREDGITGKFSLKRLDAISAISEQCEFFKDIDHELWHKRLVVLAYVYHGTLEHLYAEKEYREIYLNLRQEFKQLLKEHKKELGCNIIKTPTLYDNIYPNLMKIYWAIRKPLGKLKKSLGKRH